MNLPVNQIICGNCDSLSIYPGIALVVTSPPYYNLKEYAHWENYADYLFFCKKVLKNLYKCMTPGGWIAWNVQRKIPHPPYGIGKVYTLTPDMINIFKEVGFIYENTLVWYKGKAGSPQRMLGSYPYPPTAFLSNFCEDIILVKKAGGRKVSKVIKEKSKWTRQEWIDYAVDLWHIQPETRIKQLNHPAPFPLEIPKRLIKLFSFVEDTILDPFVGSGTTCVAAKQLGRNYIGIDISPEYCEIARKRIENDNN